MLKRFMLLFFFFVSLLVILWLLLLFLPKPDSGESQPGQASPTTTTLYLPFVRKLGLTVLALNHITSLVITCGVCRNLRIPLCGATGYFGRMLNPSKAFTIGPM